MVNPARSNPEMYMPQSFNLSTYGAYQSPFGSPSLLYGPYQSPVGQLGPQLGAFRGASRGPGYAPPRPLIGNRPSTTAVAAETFSGPTIATFRPISDRLRFDNLGLVGEGAHTALPVSSTASVSGSEATVVQENGVKKKREEAGEAVNPAARVIDTAKGDLMIDEDKEVAEGQDAAKEDCGEEKKE
jgi:hypothetical protein